MNPRHKHQLLLGTGLAATVVVEVMAMGPWRHAVWAPSLIMLVASLPTAFRGGAAIPPRETPPGGGSMAA